MRSLILDTSTNILYISFVEDKKVIYEIQSKGLNNHSDHLLNLIQEGLEKYQLAVKDFDRIIVGKGPGAYTGLRVSMTVAKMFSWTLNIPLYTISSLDLLTSGNEDGLYLVCFKAKKGYVYSKAFEYKNGIRKFLEEEKFLSVEEVEAKYDLSKYIVLNHDNIKIDCLKIENECSLVDNIHALEPNYLREC